MNKIVASLLLLSCYYHTEAQEKERFIHLEQKIKDHTYQSISMVQDTLGYMWISQVNGISKFNGYAFESIPYEDIFHQERKSDQLDQIIRDHNGTIWVLSINGEISRTDSKGGFVNLSKTGALFGAHKIIQLLPAAEQNWMVTDQGKILSYRLKEETIEELLTLPIAQPSFYSNGKMVLTPSEKLYLFTTGGKLFVYDLTTGNHEEIEWDKKNAFIFNTDMVVDRQNRLWLTTNAANIGLLVYDTKRKQFVEEKILSKKILKQSKENLSSILIDSKGIIWAGTDGNGLYKIDPDSGLLTVFNYDLYDSSSLSSNTVIDIFEDRLHNLWVANNYGEINILPNKEAVRVKHHSGAIKNSPSVVLAALKESDGTLWFGTDGKGMVRVSPNGTEQQFLVNDDFSSGFYIEDLVKDANGNLCISSQVNGPWIFDTKTLKAKKLNMTSPDGIAGTVCYAIFKDSKNRIWASTDQGLFVFDTDYRVQAIFKAEPDQPASVNFCGNVVTDDRGTLYMGFPLGLYRFEENPADFPRSTLKKVSGLHRQDEQEASLMYDMNWDGEHIWIVHSNGALSRYTPSTDDFVSFENDPRFNDVVFRSIEVQDSVNLWLGSNKGLWHLVPSKGEHTTYFKSDGFLDDAFLSSSYKDDEGNLYFGTRYGINYFSPKELTKKRTSAKLFIEGIDILNGPARSIIPDQIKTTIQNVKEIHLDHDQASFSFNYVALDNVLSPSFYYSHRLIGHNDQWTISDRPEKATYTNLPPGGYEFQVRAGTNQGIWNLGQKNIRIEVDPPRYLQDWAMTLYIAIALSVLYALYKWMALRNKLRAEELEHEADKARYDLKMNFFAKISHEIQTPLTLILIPIESMMQNAAKNGNILLQKRLKMISNNARRLSRIVFELTTVRNKELGQLKLSVSQNDIVQEVQRISASFTELAEHKKIRFETQFPKKKLKIWYDKRKIEHILYNLLSNAFKFTPEGGRVTLHIRENIKDELVLLSIADTGPGIPKEALKHIFELFYQGETGKRNQGMGIGLALVKELIDLHRGTIDVTSNRKNGTCFTMGLSTHEHTFLAHEKMHTDSSGELLDGAQDQYQNVMIDHIPGDLAKTVLIVEDNYELQDYLRRIFGEYYKVITANNGEQGFEKAKEHLPNLILSDIMMPKLNGIEMTKKLRKHVTTSHIAVILLTAEKTQVNKIMALRVGAIEYLNKPFNVNELILKVNNIITRSSRLKSKFKTDLIGTPKHPEIKSKDEVFLENMVELIEKHMENPDFKVEELAKELHISYSVVYKKFQALTGKTIVDFVRSMRIRKAAMYLTESNFSVSESAFSVGFNDPKYFSKCFKKEFGKTPMRFKQDYLKTKTNNDISSIELGPNASTGNFSLEKE